MRTIQGMPEIDWVLKNADKVEPYKVNWEIFYDRSKFNAMNGDEQKEYIASLRKKADKQLYRAFHGETYYIVSEKTYKIWLGEQLIKELEKPIH